MKNEELDKIDIIKDTEIGFVKEECPNITVQLKRNCPLCNREIYHISEKRYKRSIKLDIKCVFCRNKNNRFSSIASINSKKSLNKLKELNKENLNRLCPTCNTRITYKCYGSWWIAKKKNCKCKLCSTSQRKGIPLSLETKRKLSEGRLGEKHHFFGKTHSVEYKRKMSLRLMGSKNGFYGRKHTDKTKELIRNQSKERFEKSIYAFKMREHFSKNLYHF